MIDDHEDGGKRDYSAGRYSFFQHVECEFFPCHKTDDPDDFNCLFCYCPLYALGKGCGGDFTYTENGVKDCSKCTIPHRRDAIEYIKERFDLISSLAREEEDER